MTRQDKEPRSDEELARYFESRKDDLSQWEEKPRRMRFRRGNASTVFSIRLTEDELKSVQEAAARMNITVSGFIRDAALKSALTTLELGNNRGPVVVNVSPDSMHAALLVGGRGF